jgi:hypothetical protein
MENDAGDGIFFVSVDGAATKTVGGEAVVASHGEVIARSVRPCATFNLADASPVDVGGISVLFVACNFAGATADALCHVEVESILFA